MKNMTHEKILSYKNYRAMIRYSKEDGFLVGHIMGVRDIVGFHGDSKRELEDAFHEAVDDYLEFCARIGKNPQKPQKPRHRVSVSPEAFAAARAAAEIQGIKVGEWVSNILCRAAGS